MKKKYSKRFMAGLLSLVMASSPMGPSASVYAAGKKLTTELHDENLGDGACESTAWKWIKTRTQGLYNSAPYYYEPGGETWRFDLCGLREGQTAYDKTGISSTLLWQGFTTWLGKADESGSPPLVTDGPGDHLYKYDGDHNGAVVTTKLGAELKLSLSASPDNYYVYADYDVYNTEDKSVTYYLGTSAAQAVDQGPSYNGENDMYGLATDRGFILGEGYPLDYDSPAEAAKKRSKFEIVMNDAALGIAPKPDFRYMDIFGRSLYPDLPYDFFDHVFKDYMESDNNAWAGMGGISWGWKLNLRPYERVHRRVAFTVHPNNYYVDWTNANMNPPDQQLGRRSAPYATIQQAVDQIGNHKGYIYVDKGGPGYNGIYTPQQGPVVLNGDSNQDITLTAYNSYDEDGYGGPTSFAENSADASPAIRVTGGGTLRLHDIELWGSNRHWGYRDGPPSRKFPPTSTMISVTNGRLELGSGSCIKNCRGRDLSMGGAVDVTGPSSLILNRCTVTDNTSYIGGKGAVHFAGSGDFQADGAVTVQDNYAEKDLSYPGWEAIEDKTTPSNVYIEDGKAIQVAGSLNEERPGGGQERGRIGVTTSVLPEISPGELSTRLSQEIEAARPVPDSAADVSPSPFADNFTADGAAAGYYTAAGSKTLSEVPDLDPGHGKQTVLKRNGYNISFVYRDQELQTPLHRPEGQPPLPASIALFPGDPIAPPITAPSIDQYTLVDAVIDQGSFSSLVRNEDKTITGTMPAQDVTIYFDYAKTKSQLIFVPNGGTPEPVPLEGVPGSPVQGDLPSIGRYGYTFAGWNDRSDPAQPDRILTALPDQFPASPIKYYAMFDPDESVRFDYTVEGANLNGDIPFYSHTQPGAYWVTHPIEAHPADIHGYRWNRENSVTVPDQFNYTGEEGGSEKAGRFDPATGAFQGKMPAQAATVRYRYSVDDTLPGGAPNEAAKSTLTIRYETENGTQVQAPDEYRLFPEASITSDMAKPAERYGYQCEGGRFTHGQDAVTDPAAGIKSAVQGTFDGAYVLRDGRMPNQDVTITYTYKSTGQRYPLIVDYIDNGSADENLKHLAGTKNLTCRAEDPVGTAANPPVAYEAPYGYTLESKSIDPVSGSVTWAEGGSDFTGRMPNESATVAYRFNRDADKWTDLTYKAGKHGTLGAGASPDVKADPAASAGSVYTVQVIKMTADHEGWTLGEIKTKGLTPATVSESRYYTFGGWFLDADGDGLPDPEEVFPEDLSRLPAGTVLTAYFKETPGLWIDIHLASAGHGIIDAGQNETIHTTYDNTWGGIQDLLPVHFSPEPHFTVDPQNAWYLGTSDTVMTPQSGLKKDQTYTVRFVPDPEIFGTNAAEPDAQPGINGQGEGRITVYRASGQGDLMKNYQYVLTDQGDIVLAVLPGSSEGRIQFDHLKPGAGYLVYEAATRQKIKTGKPISGSLDPADEGVLSPPSMVLTPVVETNYKVAYDEKTEGKTVLTVSPADRSSSYAVLDKNGAVVGYGQDSGQDEGHNAGQEEGKGWKNPSGTPASVRFAGLNYNEEYTVVAKPEELQASAEDRREDGTVILTDLGAEPELTSYIVETLDGTIEQVGEKSPDACTRYNTAHKGERITVTAPETTPDGRSFQHWEVLIGPDKVNGLNLSSRTAEFPMTAGNLVLHAVYDKAAAATPADAQVTDELRGDKKGQLALDPGSIPVLEAALTTDLDRSLMADNHMKVLYKAVYQKTAVKATESDAVMASPSYNENHEQACKALFGFDITAERYVGGRRVLPDSPMNTAIKTWVQTGKSDTDQLDYQLYEITDESGEPKAELVYPIPDSEDEDPAGTGGLFAFNGHLGGRYVLVCSQAYRLNFINDTAYPGISYSFRVRKGEAPADGDYDTEYGGLPTPVGDYTDAAGVHYYQPVWSYPASPPEKPRPFDDTKAVTKKTVIHAWYQNDKKEVEQSRKNLIAAIAHAAEVGNDHFLHPDEQEIALGFVRDAQTVLDQKNPMADRQDLEDAITVLKDELSVYESYLAQRYEAYHHIHDNEPQAGGGEGQSGGGSGSGGGNNGGGGSGSSGRSGSGSSGGSGSNGGSGAAEQNASGPGAGPASWTEPLNGSWETVSGENGQAQVTQFLLNGEEPLKDRWAFLEPPQAAQSAVEQGAAQNQAAQGPVPEASDAGPGWYHFDEQGELQTGWFCGTDGRWYYLNTESEGNVGRMQTGFKQTPGGPETYYLDPADGAMATGWLEIDGRWYYFNPVSGNIYTWDPVSGQWIRGSSAGKPLGAMYKDETTPDGYPVGPDGAWLK